MIVDLIISALLAFGAWRGYRYGLTATVGSTVGMVVGVLACRLLGDIAYRVLCLHTDAEHWVGAPVTGSAVACALLYAVIYVACLFAGRTLRQLLKAVMLGWADKWGGAVFGVLKYALAASIVLNVLYAVDPDNSLMADDAFLQTLQGVAPWIWGIGAA